MASNNLVPIQLNPTLNNSDKVAYINENFRIMGDAFNPIRMSDGAVDRIVIGKYNDGTTTKYGIIGRDSDGNIRTFIGEDPTSGNTVMDFYDASGNLVSRNTGDKTTYYDTDLNIVAEVTGDNTIYYDTDDARILIGKAPDDGRIGIWVSKTGVDVITELSA